MESNPQARLLLAQACELCLGLPSVFLDDDVERKKFYGKAGSVRFKPYGIEYRVLSNFWLTSDRLMSHVFNQAKEAAQMVIRRPDDVARYFDVAADQKLDEIINTKDKDRANILYNYFDPFLQRPAI